MSKITAKLFVITHLSLALNLTLYSQGPNTPEPCAETDPVLTRDVTYKNWFIGDKDLTDPTIAIELEAFKRRTSLSDGECVSYIPARRSIHAFLKDPSFAALQKYFTIERGSITVASQPSLVTERLKQYVQRYPLQLEESLLVKPRSSLEEKANVITFEFFQWRLEEFYQMVSNADVKPYSLLVQVKLISATQEEQNDLAGLFAGTQSFGSSNANGVRPDKLSLLSKLTPDQPIFNLRNLTPSMALDVAFDAMRKNDKHRRYLFADITTTDSTVEGWKQQAFSVETDTPTVANSSQLATTIVSNKVGLNVVIKSVEVLADTQFQERHARMELEFDKFTEAHADIDQKMDEALAQENFSGLNLKRIDEYLAKRKQFQDRLEALNASLKIRVSAVVKDGGKTGVVVASGTLSAAETNTTVYELTETLTNGVPRFIGGNSGSESKNASRKVPLLGDIPLISRFFRSDSKLERKDSAAGFITVSILTQKIQHTTASAFTTDDLQEVVPTWLGGQAPDGGDTPRLSTGIPSRLRWMYDRTAKESYLTATLKMESAFGERLIAGIFAKRLYDALDRANLHGLSEWFDFESMRRRLDFLPGYDRNPHPVLTLLQKLQAEVKGFSGKDLSITEILAIVRDQGMIGRGRGDNTSDDRIFMYMVWLAANYAGETGVFNHEEASEFAKGSFDISRMLNNPRKAQSESNPMGSVGTP